MCRFYVSRVKSNPCGRDLLRFLLLHCTPRYNNFSSSYSTSTGSLKVPVYSGGPMSDRFSSCTRRGACLSRSGFYHRTTSQAFGSVLIQRTRHVGSPTAPNISIPELLWHNLLNMATRIVCMPVREAAKERSRCGCPNEHMGLMAGWRRLRKSSGLLPVPELSLLYQMI